MGRPAEERGDLPSWRDHLLLTARGAIKPVRENLVLALDGLPGRGIAAAPGCGGVIGFNAFTNDCWRRCNSDHPRRSNLDQGRKAGRRPASCG